MPSVLVAPDSFKGTFTAAQVADAVARGLEQEGFVADRCPVADGGEGTQDALLAAIGGQLVGARVHGPLGHPIETTFALLHDGLTAVVETASASGLGLVSEGELDPWKATSLGTGELILQAIEAGATNILVAAGGSATVDGGIGALQALSQCEEKVRSAHIIVLCDVLTAWERCAHVYGPQKGADVDMVERLAARLNRLAAHLPRDPRGIPATGAAGGLSGALWATYGASLEPGASRVLDVVRFDDRLEPALCVVCGEGRLDAQTSEGKVISQITSRARAAGVPAHAIVGSSTIRQSASTALGLASVTTASSLEELQQAGGRLGRNIARGHVVAM